MEKFLNFVSNNYLIFIIIAVILILALIGYLAEAFTSREFIVKKKDDNNLSS